MIGKCTRCGACCIAIVLPNSTEKTKGLAAGGDKGLRFIVDNFSEISREEALNRNPHLSYTEEGESFFYECKKFDKVKKVCIDYENRGEVCRGFPWGHSIYKTIDLNTKFYSKDCGYKIDQDIYRLQINYLTALIENKTLVENNLNVFFQKMLDVLKKDKKDDVVFFEVRKTIEATVKKLMKYFHLRFSEAVSDDFKKFQKNIDWGDK